MEIQKITMDEITLGLFSGFTRYQEVTKCWRKRNGKWIVIDNPFVEDWTQADYTYLVQCLRHTAAAGCVVYGAFENGTLKGFASVEPVFFGSSGQYLELSAIHVSRDCRGKGIGRRLMDAAKKWAREKKARKLYISAHSSVESQAFYRAMGCREAAEYSRPHVEKEPCDCQLELDLTEMN